MSNWLFDYFDFCDIQIRGTHHDMSIAEGSLKLTPKIGSPAFYNERADAVSYAMVNENIEYNGCVLAKITQATTGIEQMNLRTFFYIDFEFRVNKNVDSISKVTNAIRWCFMKDEETPEFFITTDSTPKPSRTNLLEL